MKVLLRRAVIFLMVVVVEAAANISFSSDAEARRGGHAIRSGKHISHAGRHINHAGNHYRRYYDGRRVAIGVGTGIAIGAATNSYRYSCGNLVYRCDRGESWTCREYSRRCY